MQLYRLDGKVLTLAWVLLGVAITAEVTGTLALKASDGLSRPWAAALVAVGLTLLGVAPALASSAVFSGVTKTFPYRQKKFLFSRQGPGALVHVPDAAAEGEVPLPPYLRRAPEASDRDMGTYSPGIPDAWPSLTGICNLTGSARTPGACGSNQ